MIKTYDDTWHFYCRQLQLTVRRGDFVPYFVNRSLYNFLSDATSKVLDIGCGENNLKLFFPEKIHGIDRTIEADTFGFIEDDSFRSLPNFEYGIAVNSLHWNDIHTNISVATSKCKKIWISLNENQPLDQWKNIDTWKQYGNVEYFWHGQKEETKTDIKNFLKSDHLYPYMSLQRNRNLDEDVETIYNNTVLKDPYYGVIRVILSNE